MDVYDEIERLLAALMELPKAQRTEASAAFNDGFVDAEVHEGEDAG